MFALESLGIAGETHANSERVKRACNFLEGKQMADGGWGETYMVSPPLPSPPLPSNHSFEHRQKS